MRRLPWLAGAVLAAGVAASLIAFFGLGNTGKTFTPLPVGRSTQVQRPVKEKTLPLAREARLVARRFILTAVARRNLAEAYALVGPQLRGGLTRDQWMTGAIPVVPYPVNLTRIAPMKVDFSYRNHALLEVALIPRDGAKLNGVSVKPQLFFLELSAYGKGQKRRWVVTSWVPRGQPHVPTS